ncbi:hypothetical protein HDU97_002843 [Phlyctochytrium planicorne]|nr:hypothetical protein HDU97_002843 [Phlyctochytrium planicorne]
MLPLRVLLSAVVAFAGRSLAQSCSYTDSSIAPNTYEAAHYWYSGSTVWCYNLDTFQPIYYFNEVHITQAIQPVYPDGSVAGELVFQYTPCDATYSPAVSIKRVLVDEGAAYDSITSYDAAVALSPFDGDDGVHNTPIVPHGSVITDSSFTNGNIPQTLTGWFNGQQVSYFDFGRIPFYENQSDKWVPAANAIQIEAKGAPSGLPILDVISDSTTYTGFYSLKTSTVTDEDYIPNLITSAASLPSPAVNVNHALIINCPFAHYEVQSSIRVGDKTDNSDGTSTSSTDYIPDNENYPIKLTLTADALATVNEQAAEIYQQFLIAMKEMTKLIPYMNKAILCDAANPKYVKALRTSRFDVINGFPSVVNLLLNNDAANYDNNLLVLQDACE